MCSHVNTAIQYNHTDWLQGHGGVFGLGMEGPEDDGGEGNLGRVEKNTKRAESNLAPP